MVSGRASGLVAGEAPASFPGSAPGLARGSVPGGERLVALGFLAPVLFFVGTFVALPLADTFVNSFFRDVSFLPRRFCGLANYARLFESPDFWSGLGFTLLFALTAVGLETLLGLAFAVLLNERFPGRTVLRLVMLLPWAIPTIVSARTWRLLYDYSHGLVNAVLLGCGLVDVPVNWFGTTGSAFLALVAADVWKTTPFVALLLLAGLQAIPEELYEQARVDGAGIWTRFRVITLPLLQPVLLVAVIFRTIDSLRMFDLVYVLTGGGPGGTTRTLSYLGYEAMGNDDFGTGAAVSVVTFLIALVFTLAYLRIGRFRDNLLGKG